MTSSRKFASIIIALAISLSSSGNSDAQEQSGKEILQKASDYASSLGSFTADFEIQFEAVIDGEIEAIDTDYTIAMKRPASLSVHMKNPATEQYFFTSDTQTIQYIPEFNQYVVVPQRTPPEKIVRAASNSIRLPAIAIFAELVKESPFAPVLAADTPIEIIGQEKINDVLCDQVRFTYTDFKCDVWIEQGENAVIHRIVPDLSPMKEGYIQQGINVETFDTTLNILYWQPNYTDDSILTYTPKEDVELVAQFYRPLPPAPALKFIGKEAPLIELKQLDGETFTLASKIGKEIIVLDFWATWCTPCRIGMPILEKVTNEFEDVKLYAINRQEGPDLINLFMKEAGLDLNVLLDSDDVASVAYLAETIPLTIIIGRDGLVKKVHNGISRTYEEDIRAELTEVVKEDSATQ